MAHPWLASGTAPGAPAVELDASILDGLKAFTRSNDARHWEGDGDWLGSYFIQQTFKIIQDAFQGQMN